MAFRDGLADLNALDARVIGVSTDTLEEQRAFAAKNSLNFPLVSDRDGKIAALYGVDTSSGHAKRTTFVIGADGRILKTFYPVKVEGHDGEVLAVLRSAAPAKK